MGMFNEEWRVVPRFPNYMVSDQGRVAKLMTPYVNKEGYQRIGMTRVGQVTKKFVHVLVLETFRGKAPVGQECRHGNGTPSDNCLENLRWGTPVENSEDKRRHGRLPMGESNPNAVLRVEQVAEARRRYRVGDGNFSSLSRDYGCSNVSMRKAILGITRNDANHLEPPVSK